MVGMTKLDDVRDGEKIGMALEFGKVGREVDFRCGIFRNLGRDHYQNVDLGLEIIFKAIILKNIGSRIKISGFV